MRRMKKIIPLLLSFVFVISSVMTLTAFAATEIQDGLEAVLTFDKAKYAANEEIKATLTVKNKNAYTVKGIQTELVLPEGITLKSGELTQKAFTLEGNESKQQEVVLIKKAEPSKPVTNKNNPSKTDKTTKQNNASKTGTTTTQSNGLKTGDSSYTSIFVALMLLSGGALLVLCIRQKKLHAKGLLSVLLCCAIVGTMLQPMTANAASKQKEIDIEEVVKIDEKDTTIKAKVSYEFVQYSDVTVTDGTGTGSYAEGETVTITANEAPEGQHFTGWTVEKGNITLADSTNVETTFVMPAEEVKIKANYAADMFTITAIASEGGKVEGTTTVSYGGSSTFKITPNERYHIEQVEIDGGNQGKIDTYTFNNVKKNHEIKATFAIDTYAVTVANGTGTAFYAEGETVTITANEAPEGQHFTGWTVEKGNVTFADKTNAETTFVMPAEEVKIKANYEVNVYTITVETGENGKVTPEGEVKVEYDKGQTFMITPNEGYHIAKILVDGENVAIANTYTFNNVNDNHKIEVTFAVDTFTITAIASEGGKVEGTTTVSYGGSSTFTITPNERYHIEQVEVDGVNQGKIDTYTFNNVKKNHEIKATFAIDTYAVTVTNGTGTAFYAEGETVTITANEAPEGQHFTGWTVEKGNVTFADKTNAETTFVMPAEEVEVKANYDVNTYTITVETGNNGEITPNTAEVQYGGEQKFEIKPVTGYHILDVEIDGVSKGAITEYTFADVKEPHTIKATFEIDTFTITATAGANGTITETATVNYSDSKTFTITPNAHYHIADVEVDGVSKGAITSYTFENVKETHTIKATFAVDTFTIEVTSGENGAISPDGEVNVEYDKNQTFAITPNTGYHIVDVEVDGMSKGAITSYTFENVKKTHTIKATFAIDTFTITATAGANGTITETATVNYGDSKTFGFNPDEGYGVADVLVDGKSVGAESSYTFENIDKDHSIEVIFGVSTTESFESALENGGTIYLAQDIVLLDSRRVTVEKSLTIYGKEHKINGFLTVDMDGTLKLFDCTISKLNFLNGKVLLENCSLDYLTLDGSEVWDCYPSVEIFSSEISTIYFGEEGKALIKSGSFEKITFRDSVAKDTSELNVYGGTFYFDPTQYVNTDTHKVTPTKDTDGVDIWVVTEK